MKENRFVFVSKTADKEYKNLPKEIQSEFGVSLRAIQENKKPFLKNSGIK